MMRMLDKYRGALIGLAACDALGTTLEFRSPGTFTPISNLMPLILVTNDDGIIPFSTDLTSRLDLKTFLKGAERGSES